MDRSERLELIKALAAEGLSASAIGARLGVTKNVVTGLCVRAGVRLGSLSGWTYPMKREKAERLPRGPSRPRRFSWEG